MKTHELDRMVSAVKKMFDEKRDAYYNAFLNYVDHEVGLMDAIKKISGADALGPVCDMLLDFHSREYDEASPSNVIECLVGFSAAVTLINSEHFAQRLEESKTINHHMFYDKYIHPSVSLTWNIVSKKSTTTNVRTTGTGLSKSVGAMLVGINDVTNQRRWGAPPLDVYTYAELKEILEAFCAYILTIKDNRGRTKGGISKSKAEIFCGTDVYKKIKEKHLRNQSDKESNPMETSTSGNQIKIRKRRQSYPQSKKTIKKGSLRQKPSPGLSTNGCRKPSPNQVQGHDDRLENNISTQLNQFNREFKSTYGSTTLSSLLDELKTAKFEPGGRMTLEESDMIRFWNSPLVSALFHHKINRQVAHQWHAHSPHE